MYIDEHFSINNNLVYIGLLEVCWRDCAGEGRGGRVEEGPGRAGTGWGRCC